MCRSLSLVAVLAFFLLLTSSALAQVTSTLPGLSTAAELPRTPQVLGISDDDQAVREKLKKRTSVDWMQVELRTALEGVGRDLGVQVQLDPEGLEEAGVAKDQEIQFTCKDRRGDQVLRLFLEPLHLAYVVKHGVLMITSREKAGEQLSTRAYNVRDLVEPWPAKDLGAKAPAGPLPVPEGTQVVWSGKSAALARLQNNEDFDTLIDLVTSMVSPDSWNDFGGTGSISGFRGLLVVSQTEDVHSDIELLLRQLRAGERSQPGDVIQFPE